MAKVLPIFTIKITSVPVIHSLIRTMITDELTRDIIIVMCPVLLGTLILYGEQERLGMKKDSLASMRGRLVNLKNYVARFVKIRSGGKIGAAALLATVLFGSHAFAIDYIIDSTQPQSGTTYPTLNLLRTAPGIPTWNGDTITLKNNDTTLTAVFYSGMPTANGTMSFIADPNALVTAGLSQFMINGSSITRSATSRFMNITGTNSATLVLDNIALSNFGLITGSDNNGGAIRSAGSLMIEGDNAGFYNNVGGSDGGAIYMENNTTLSLIGGSITFDGNSTVYNGGAIRVGGDLLIDGSVTFSNNTGNMGGAIINGAVGSNSVINGNVYFSKNIANSSGGAFYTNGRASFIGTTVFEENRSGSGIVFLGAGSSNEFSGTTTFTKNAVTSNGGAIYVNSNSITTYSGTTTFTDNTANSSGAAVYALSNSTSIYSGTTDFTANKAGTTGGAITIAAGSGGTSTLAFTNGSSSFTGNEAGRTGGAIMMIDNGVGNSSVLNFSGGINSFNGNKAGTTTNNYGGGGAIFMGNNSTLNFTGGINSFTDNTSGTSTYTNNGGGAISMGNTTALNFFGGTNTFDRNTAMTSGGAILATATAVMTFNGSETSFTGNKAMVNGGAISTQGTITTSDNLTFTGNEAGGHGGAIYTTNSLNFLTGSTTIFDGNKATGTNSDGGALYFTGSLTADGDMEFSNNTAGLRGGAIYTTSAMTIASDIQFTNNIAGTGGIDGHGGAIYTISDLSLTGSSIVFNDNQATGTNAAGGAINQSYQSAIGLLTLGAATSTIEFKNNSSVVNGGAIYTNSDLAIDGQSVTFSGNTAGKDGGAILNMGVGTISTINGNVSFSNNMATGFGGAFYTNGDANFVGTTEFIGNKTNGALNSTSGGAVWVGNGNSTFSGITTFTNNEASGLYGGAVYAAFGNSEYNGTTTFTNNSSTMGGAIGSNFWVNLDFTGTTTFDQNKATGTNGNGGAIYVNTSMNGSLVDFSAGTSTFTGNSATDKGGAIYMNNICSGLTTLDFTGGTNRFAGNTAGTDGGALYLKDNLTLNFIGGDNSFSNNEAGTNGGAIYTTNADVNFTAGINSFSGNEAGTNGGAIYAMFADINFTDGTNSFSGNGAQTNGGAIYITNADVNFIAGINSFSGNEAGTNGGAIYAANADINFTDGDNLFASNGAGTNGGAIYATNANVNFTSGTNTFVGNTAAANGGAIWSDGTVNIDVVTTFRNNFAGGRGGAIAMDGANAVLNIDATLYDQLFIGNSDSTGKNDIFLSNGAVANLIVADGHSAFLGAGITDRFNAVSGGHQQNLTKTGLGTLTFGAESISYLHGNVNIDAGIFRLENGASFGYDTINNVNVGNVTLADDVTVSYQFAANGFDHSWIQGDTITIANGTQFDLEGVIWQPSTSVIYNLAESRFDQLGGTMNVTLGLDRGSFMADEDVANWSWQSDPNVSDWFFRDFTYYVDDEGKLFKSFVNGTHLGNIYAVELFRKDEVIGVDALYVDPSLKNRILSQRLDRCCPSCSTTPTCSQWNTWVEGYGTGGSVGNYQGKNGFNFSTGGMLMGIEKETADNHRLGFYYGYGNSWTTDRSINYKGKSENTFGGYLRIADPFGYTLLMGNLGHNSYRSSRFIDTALGRETFNANFGAFTSGAYLERGFDWKMASHTCLTPFAALQYSHLSTNWYDETASGGSDARLAQTAKLGYDSLRTLVGARTKMMLRNRLNWNNAIHWEHELTRDGAVVRDEYLTTNPALNAKTVGNYGGRDWVVYGTGLEFAITPNMSLNAGYDLSFNKKATFHTGMGGLTYTF